MDINITGRNVDLDPEIKKYVYKKLGKVDKLYSRIYKCEVILDVEKIRYMAEIVLSLKRNRIVAKESSTDIYASIDKAVDSVKKQLRRISGKVSAKRRKAVLDNIMGAVRRKGAPVYNEPLTMPETRGEILKEDMFADKPMSPEDARLEIELNDRSFIMFRNAETGKDNVVYKRNDGNYGLIESRP